MRGIILFSFVFFLFTAMIYSQERNLSDLENQFQSFNYEKAIGISENLLREKENFSDEEIERILLIKGISHFSLDDERSARVSFIELLKIDEKYEPDPVETSPKIIRFFNDVKNEYDQIITEESVQQITKVDTVFVKEPVYVQSNLKNVLSRSVALPGWGHIYSGQKTKGIFLTAASAGLIGASVYYIIDTRNKEKDYLSETQSRLFQSKYDEYNKSYKTRNILLFSYLAVWLYSQSDILFFNPPENLELNLNKDNNQGYNLNLRYYF